jgi:NADPH:quinone reductase-like Zn-dependent oxidoreductase
MMKAATYSKYGPPSVVHITTIPKPIPKPQEILIKIKATTVTAGDHRMRSSDLPGFGFLFFGRLALGVTGPRNKILGVEFSGEVEAIGSKVTKFKVGDAVFGGHIFKTHAEYLTMSENDTVVKKPNNVGFDIAACATFGGNTALTYLVQLAKVKPGEKVLINGASGAVGSAMVQIAKQYCNAHVTGVCSTGNVDLVKSLGSDEVIDYTTNPDISQLAKKNNPNKFDVILDTHGNWTWSKCEQLLNDNGRLCLISTDLTTIMGSMFSGPRGKRIIAKPVDFSLPNIVILSELLEQGKYKPLIDKQFKLDDIVEAHKYVDSGKKKGNVLVDVALL